MSAGKSLGDQSEDDGHPAAGPHANQSHTCHGSHSMYGTQGSGRHAGYEGRRDLPGGAADSGAPGCGDRACGWGCGAVLDMFDGDTREKMRLVRCRVRSELGGAAGLRGAQTRRGAGYGSVI